MNECYCFDDVTLNPDEWDAYTGTDEWNAVYTVQLGELLASGVFNWNLDILNWKAFAFDDTQYSRICAYFIERFMYREICIEPFREWAVTLKRKIAYELMPKYKPLYERVAEGVNPLANSNEYYKNRTITSAYPETLLSDNSDYVTDGRDEEHQKITEGAFAETMAAYAEKYKGVDEMMLDDLESMFISMYTANVNAIW